MAVVAFPRVVLNIKRTCVSAISAKLLGLLSELRKAGIDVKHYIPGRLRIAVAQVKHNPALAQDIQRSLGSLPGITGVEAHPTTGSVLILFDGQLLAGREAHNRITETLAQLFPRVSQSTWRALWESAA